MTGPQDAHAWLTARWQEWLDTALRAREWPDVGIVVEGDKQGVPFVASEATVEHIAAAAPDRIIAVCEAALRTLERHAPTDGGGSRPFCPEHPRGFRRWPCNDVLCLASPWATREDYPEELRRG